MPATPSVRSSSVKTASVPGAVRSPGASTAVCMRRRTTSSG